MELTGKCKEDFEQYLQNLELAPYVSMLDQIPKCYLNALIVDFFDSVGLTIDRNTYGKIMNITDWRDGLEKQYAVDCDYLEPFEEWYCEAIRKVNNIYNNE
jgi:hypothetical protein